MRILVLSKEAWRDEQNGGNVLSNIFQGFNASFAQIYCTDLYPNNTVCSLYYQMTDNMMINSIFRHGNVGRILKYDEPPRCDIDNRASSEAYSRLKRFNSGLIRIAREIVWSIARWDKNGIRDFVLGFNPDIVFAPCYGSHYMIRLTKIVNGYVHKPIISYISDDFYTNRQFSLSPFFWINHFILRKKVREVFSLYSLVYTMTDEQKKQCEYDFGANMKILRKGGSFSGHFKETVHSPIRMVYAGGLYLNRWKTLSLLVSEIRKINHDGIKIQLDVYSNTPLSKRQRLRIEDGDNARIHPIVKLEELSKIYQQSDIALHVEGFDIKNRLKVRLSFSTKIIDCLDSGCAVMAICDNSQAGFQYLKKNGIAFCVNCRSMIKRMLYEILNKPQLIIEMQKKAYQFGRINHKRELVANDLRQDFDYYVYGGRAIQ